MMLLRQSAFALRNLTRQRRRSLLGLAIIVGGVVAFLLAGGFINWIFQDLRESTIHSQLGHLQITRPGYFREGIGNPYEYLLPGLGEAHTKGISNLKTLTPRLAFSGLVSLGDETISFVGEGINPEQEAPIARSISIVSGRDLAGSDASEALLGEGLASNLGAKAGDTIVLLATTAAGGVNAVELLVAGTFATITKAYDDSVLRAPINIARELMQVEGATSWVALLDETDMTEAAVSQFRSSLDESDYEITPWSALADFYNKTVELFSRQVGVVRLLIALIVILSISNTLSMSVIERTSEIGTMMALGVKRGGILQLFVLEGALLGIIGAIVGTALGWLLASIISSIGIPMPPPPGMARGYIGQIAISPTLVIDGVTLAIGTTLLASIAPAWKASRMTIVDALRQAR